MEQEHAEDDWVAGTTFEAYTEVADEPVLIALDGIDFGAEDDAERLA